jgi:hypothetical protein
MEDLQKSLRNQYSNDNEAYKKALAENNITPGNSTGKVRGIQQAYYDGTIDKGTRDYMMADTIAKFARNTGRDIGNIGAQFTGGTVNNNFETSNWDKRNEELFKQQTSAEAASIENSDKGREATGQNLANEKSDKALAASRLMEEYKNKASKKAEELRAKGNDAGAAIMDGIAGEYALLTSGATSSIDKEEHIANILSSLSGAVASGDLSKTEMMDYAKTVFAGMGGGIGTGIDVNIENPFAKDKTGNEALDAPTENDKSSNIINMGVSNDIRDVSTDFDKLDPTGKVKLVRQLYQGQGGGADKFKLAALVASDKIDPNADYNGIKGSVVIDKVAKNLENEKFAEDFKHYTNMDVTSGNTIPQRKQQVEAEKREKARKVAAEDASKFKMDLNNLSEDNINTLKEYATKKGIGAAFSGWDNRARNILDYLGIPY